MESKPNEPDESNQPPTDNGNVPKGSIGMLKGIGSMLKWLISIDKRWSFLLAVAVVLSLVATFFGKSDSEGLEPQEIVLGSLVIIGIALLLLFVFGISRPTPAMRRTIEALLGPLYVTVIKAAGVMVWGIVVLILILAGTACVPIISRAIRGVSAEFHQNTVEKPALPLPGSEQPSGRTKTPVPVETQPISETPPKPHALFQGLKHKFVVAAGTTEKINKKKESFDTLEIQEGGKLILPATGCELLVRELIIKNGEIVVEQDPKVVERSNYEVEMTVWDAQKVEKLTINTSGRNGEGYEPGKRAGTGATGKSAGGERLFNPTGHGSDKGGPGSDGAKGGRGQDALNFDLFIGTPPATAQIAIFANGGKGGRGQDGGTGGQGGSGSEFHSASSGGPGGAAGAGGDGGHGGIVKVMPVLGKTSDEMKQFWETRIAIEANLGPGGESGVVGAGGPSGGRGNQIIQVNAGNGSAGAQGTGVNKGKDGKAGAGTVNIETYDALVGRLSVKAYREDERK